MSTFTCPICDFCFSRNYNLKRHLFSKHNITSETSKKFINARPQQIISPPQQPVISPPQIISPPETIHENEANKCTKCQKSFSHNWCLTRHKHICKGIINKLECEHCNTQFKHITSKYKHYKTCPEKNKLPEPVAVNNSTNINNNTNATINSNNNTINNNVNLTIVYKIGDETIDFNREHLTEDVLKKILGCNNNTESIKEYVKQIFTNPENRFIKKHSLRESHSQLHVGENKWEHVLDKEVYPELATTFANDMLEYIYTKQHALKRSAFEKLRDTLDYLSDSGYINTDDREVKKKIENEFKLFVKNLKLIVHNVEPPNL